MTDEELTRIAEESQPPFATTHEIRLIAEVDRLRAECGRLLAQAAMFEQAAQKNHAVVVGLFNSHDAWKAYAGALETVLEGELMSFEEYERRFG
jgi:hypothetical protein